MSRLEHAEEDNLALAKRVAEHEAALSNEHDLRGVTERKLEVAERDRDTIMSSQNDEHLSAHAPKRRMAPR